MQQMIHETPQDRTLAAIIWIADHQPTHAALEQHLGISRATITRMIGRARRLGVRIEYVRGQPMPGVRGGSSGHYRISSWGVFSPARLRAWAAGKN